MRQYLFLFSLLLMFVTQAIADGPGGQGRLQLEQFAENLQGFHARFEQVVKGTDGEIQEQSSGDVWMQQPDRFRWSYEGDFPQLIIADGSKVWIYDEALEQVTVKQQAELVSSSPLVLLSDLTLLDEQYAVHELGDYDGMHLLELDPRSGESEFDRILLGFQESQLRMMAMEDAFGLRTEIRFAENHKNPEMESELFVFDIPENTDVIGDLGEDLAVEEIRHLDLYNDSE